MATFPISDPFFATPPEGTCPTTFTEAVNQLNALKQGAVTGNFLPYVIGFNTPSVDDQDKAWIRLDSAGRPLGTFVYYGGSWRRMYTGKPQEMTFFNGDPSTYFDGTGLGLTTAEWDGWAICNGNNGTPNLTDKFIVAAHMDDSGGSSGYGSSEWRTKVSGGLVATGGVASVTLGPLYIYRDPSDEVRLDKFTADGNARSDSGSLLGHYSGVHDPDGSEIIIAADEGNTTPSAFSILPPYYAMAIVKFVGYA